MKRRSNISMVAVDKIEFRPEIQTRAEINEQTVADYKVALENGAKFPPIEVAYIGANGGLAVVSGHHRLLAHRAAGRDKIECDVRYEIKNITTALEFATKANHLHGLRPSLKDRQHNLRQWLKHYRLFKKTDSAIAKAVGVDHKTVKALRDKLEAVGEIPTCQKRTGADGKQYSATKPTKPTKPKPEKPAPQPAPKSNESTAEQAPVLNAPEAVELVAKASPKRITKTSDNHLPAVTDAVVNGRLPLDEAMKLIGEEPVAAVPEAREAVEDDVQDDHEPGVEFNLGDELVSLIARTDNEIKAWPLDAQDAKRVADALRRLAARVEERAAQEAAA